MLDRKCITDEQAIRKAILADYHKKLFDRINFNVEVSNFPGFKRGHEVVMDLYLEECGTN